MPGMSKEFAGFVYGQQERKTIGMQPVVFLAG